MAAFGVGPSAVKIFYHSSAGAHVMTRPTRQWNGVRWTGPGTYQSWNDEEIQADAMVEALIDLFLPIYSEDVVFDSYIIYDVDESDPDHVLYIPNFAKLLTGKNGDIALPSNHLAFQKTFSFLTTESHNAKLVLLDVPTGGVINKVGSVSGAEAAIVAEFMSGDAAWSGRDDERPIAFRSLNNSVNKALERKYGF